MPSLFLWLKGWHAPAGRRTCEPRPLAKDGQIRPARRWVPQEPGPGRRTARRTARKGRQPIRRSGRTQAPDPTPEPPQNRASRAGPEALSTSSLPIIRSCTQVSPLADLAAHNILLEGEAPRLAGDCLIRYCRNREVRTLLAGVHPGGLPQSWASVVYDLFAWRGRRPAPSVRSVGGEDLHDPPFWIRRSGGAERDDRQIVAVCFDANDPLRLARFWTGVLGWELADGPHDGVALLPSDDTGFRLRFLPTQKQKDSQNQTHFDLTSTSLEDQQQRSRRRSSSAAATSTSVSARRRSTSCSPIPKATSSA